MKKDSSILENKNYKTSFTSIPEKDQLYPITSILVGIPPDDISNDKLIFCYKASIQAIHSCLESRYSDFDALTKSNCCHGMTIFTKKLIKESFNYNLNKILSEGELYLQLLQAGKNNSKHWMIPKCLIELTCLYILGFTRDIDLLKGHRTNKYKIKKISPVGTRFCDKIIDNLQKRFSNIIANQYYQYAVASNGIKINGFPMHIWGKYVAPEYLRMDKFGVQYAANLFSMQVALGHLIETKTKLVIINDIIGQEGKIRDRQVYLFEGDGKETFKHINRNKIRNLNDYREPVIIFGGCAYSKDDDLDTFDHRMEDWISRLPSLILACDVKYPHFPNASDDPEFNNNPLKPQEDFLVRLLENHTKFNGVCWNDPSFFCLSHIYPASLGQIMKLLNESPEALPISFIPLNRLSKDILVDLNLSQIS